MTRAMGTEMAEQERAGRQAQCHRMRRPSFLENQETQEHPRSFAGVTDGPLEELEKGLGLAGLDVLREPYQGSP